MIRANPLAGDDGFIGVYLVPLLLDSGRRVTVLGRRILPSTVLPAGVGGHRLRREAIARAGLAMGRHE